MKASFGLNLRGIYTNLLSSLGGADKQKITGYAYLVLTLLTVSFFGIFAISPTLNTISNLNKQYRDNELVYASLKRKLENLKLLEEEYQGMQLIVPLVYDAIPQKADMPKLTRQIENIAKKNTLQIIDLRFSTVEIFPNVKKETMYSYTFTINVSGSKTSINEFIAQLINFNRIVGLERATTGRDREDKYTASITGRSFFSIK